MTHLLLRAGSMVDVFHINLHKSHSRLSQILCCPTIHPVVMPSYKHSKFVIFFVLELPVELCFVHRRLGWHTVSILPNCVSYLQLISPERDAMGCDEYQPTNHTGFNLSSSGGIGYTIVDAIDTMHLMGLTDEYARARNWINNSLSFDKPATVSLFEV